MANYKKKMPSKKYHGFYKTQKIAMRIHVDLPCIYMLLLQKNAMDKLQKNVIVPMKNAMVSTNKTFAMRHS